MTHELDYFELGQRAATAIQYSQDVQWRMVGYKQYDWRVENPHIFAGAWR